MRPYRYFKRRVASPAAVLAVSAGGLLADRAGAENAPLLDVDIDSEPRSAVGYNLMLLLGLLSQLGLAEIDGPDVNRSVAIAFSDPLTLDRRCAH